MAETAVGLFEDASVAEAVVDSLRAHGFPSNGIRVVAAPGVGASGTNRSGDFTTLFSRDQRAIGVPDEDASYYLDRVHGGNVLVYATGTKAQATEAVAIMDEFAAIEVGSVAGSGFGTKGGGEVTGTGDLGTVNPESRLPESQVTIGEHEHSYTSHASRSKKEGARVFSW